jgi:23S rRNA (uracil1939-C5)-methyltransferase
MNPVPTKNDTIQVEIDDLAYGGLGVGRLEGFVVFVEQALPGEIVTARIVKKKKNHAQAVIESIDRPSEHRVAEPPCPVFGACGGCAWQNFAYEQQTVWKQKQVADTLKHIGGLDSFELRPIVASPRPWRYRNKMEFTFGLDDDGRQMLGFHRRGRFDQLLPIDACLIQPEPSDAILRLLTRYARERNLTVYDPRTHDGFLRQAVLRHSFTTGETILTLLTTRGDLPDRDGLAGRLAAEVPGFKGMLWGLNEGLADVARIDEELWRRGAPELIETVNGLTFAISPQSFFQTNTAAAELLYRHTAALADLGPADRLLDAYCGTGAIALHCARNGGRVVGVELVTEAIWDARANARANHIENATFIAAPMAQGLELAQRAAGGVFTHVIIDPPRGGMDKRSLRGLLDLRAPVFLYVSCNPATLARDLQTITEAGYKLDVVQPVDMFPHTFHIETIVRLRLQTSQPNS